MRTAPYYYCYCQNINHTPAPYKCPAIYVSCICYENEIRKHFDIQNTFSARFNFGKCFEWKVYHIFSRYVERNTFFQPVHIDYIFMVLLNILLLAIATFAYDVIAKECRIGGCSSQLCIDSNAEGGSDCEWLV